MWSYRIYGNGGGGGNSGGAGGADLTKIGTPVTVEARNSFKKGDEFFGIKNKNVKTELLKTNYTIGEGLTIDQISKDNSVVTFKQTIKTTTKNYKIGILNEETTSYDVVNVDLPDMSSTLASGSTNTQRSYVNEDGSLIVISDLYLGSNNYNGTIVIEVNKTKKTGSAKYFSTFISNMFIYRNQTYDNCTIVKRTTTQQNDNALIKNYFFTRGYFLNNYNPVRDTTFVVEYKDGELKPKTLWLSVDDYPCWRYIYSSAIVDDNNFLVCMKHLTGGNADTQRIKLCKFTASGDGLSFSYDDTIRDEGKLSKNGKYLGYYDGSNSHVCSINSSDMTLTEFYNSTNTPGIIYPDDTGEYALKGSSIVNLSDDSVLGTGYTMNSTNFNIINDKFISGNNFVTISNNGSGAEYAIYDSIEKLDDKDGICGIVPNNMTIGETGTAQKISNIENDLFDAGIPVTVEAHNSFIKGDKFYGVKNENVEPTLLTTNFTVGEGYGIAAMSADHSVVAISQTIGPTAKTYKVGIFNEETISYDVIDIDLPDLSSLTGTGGYVRINEDGTLIAISEIKSADGYYNGVLMIEVNKENKSGSANYFDTFEVNDYNYNGYNSTIKFNRETNRSNQNQFSNPFVTKKYYCRMSWGCNIIYDNNGTTTTKTASFNVIYKYENGKFSEKPLWMLFYGSGTGWGQHYSHVWYDENTLLMCAKLYFNASDSNARIAKFTFNGDNVSYTYNGSIRKEGRFSKNGKYLGVYDGTYSYVYAFNGDDLTATQIYKSMQNIGVIYPEDTGEYALKGKLLIKLDDDSTMKSGITIGSPYFNIINDKFRNGNTFISMSNNSSEAEYIAYNSIGDINTQNHIYGVIAEDLNIGELGTAQKLYELEDDDLIPENIKKDVNVLGTTGTFEIDQTKLNELYAWCGANGAVIPTDKNLTNLLDCMKSISNITSYTVSFNTLTDQTIEPQTIVHGHTMTKVNCPTKEEYTFKYWTLNGEKFDESTPITSDITLEAYFESGYPTLMNYSTSSNSNYMLGVDTRPALSGTKPTSGSAYKNTVRSLTFLANGETPEEYYASWDVSEANDGTIILYYKSSDLYISSNAAKINLPSDCTNLFASYTSSSFTGFYGLDILMSDTTTIMKNMFSNCTKLTELDLSSFDTSNVTDMSNMFASCSSLTTLNISSFTTSKVTTMSNMFSGCSALTSLDVSNFDVSNVIDISYIFNNCIKISELNLSNWSNSKITSISRSFCAMTLVENLDLSGFNLANVKLNTCFMDNPNLKTLDLRNMNITDATVPFSRSNLSCTIYVKNETSKSKLLTEHSNLSNVIVVEEDLPDEEQPDDTLE